MSIHTPRPYAWVVWNLTKKSPEGEVIGSAMLYSQATSLATGRTTSIALPSAAGRTPEGCRLGIGVIGNRHGSISVPPARPGELSGGRVE
ncbi:hypothetical protein EVAR_34156_1 [Eumeta japonica]|uniref:Uncharacterized protein n=1 Tax=Eumeta variegata TaxID=151549 RepID=A0A4C1ZYS4_EUMVA|nr:hypothetical protein EVAR_34156_1 [Eumeta japonica]